MVTSLPAFVRNSVALVIGTLFAASAAHAQIVQTNTFEQTSAGLPVSSTDLLQTSLQSFSSTNISGFPNSDVAVLFDGALGTAGNTGGFSGVAPLPGATITINLNTTVNTLGYDITSLTTFASWDTGRDGQEYTVAFANVGAPTTFVNLFTITAFDPPGGPSNPSTSSVQLTRTGGGPLGTGVAAIRYTFTGFENQGTDYREIDAVGIATPRVTAAPEPGTLALAGMVILPLVGRFIRRRKA